MNRCCARCKTPFNCGNRDCRCHPMSPEMRERVLQNLRDQQAQLRKEANYAENHPTVGRAL